MTFQWLVSESQQSKLFFYFFTNTQVVIVTWQIRDLFLRTRALCTHQNRNLQNIHLTKLPLSHPVKVNLFLQGPYWHQLRSFSGTRCESSANSLLSHTRSYGTMAGIAEVKKKFKKKKNHWATYCKMRARFSSTYSK